MRTKLWKGMLAAVAAVGLLAGTAMADTLELGFSNTTGGGFKITGNGDGTGTIDLFGMVIQGTNPGNVGIEGYTVGNMSFNYISTTGAAPGIVTFDPGFYANGFNIYDGSTLVLTADLTMPIMEYTTRLIGVNYSGDLLINLSNVQVTSGYSSPILDQFALYPDGVLVITMNSTRDLGNILNTKGTYNGNTLSGTGSPVPEPATMLLFGAGLLGLSGIARRKMS